MIRLIQRRLIIPRGDTGTFQIPMLPGKNAGDVSIFTVFDPLSRRKLLEKSMTLENEVLSIQFSHNDTVNLPVGQFVWDIKFYSNPVFADGKLVDGEEIDSYYAAFTLPICEIRQTGDMMLMVNDAALPPDQLDILLATLNETITAKNNAADSATNADASATAAAASAQAALDSETAALTSQQSASAAASNAASSATAAAASAQLAQQTAQAIHEEIPTKVSDLEDDSGHYTKPANGIPASDLEETYVKFTDYATSNKAGVVRVDINTSGMSMYNDRLMLIPANHSMIKEATAQTRALSPSIEHEAAFYGLAKASGDTTQSQSDNAVGTYTSEAKASIQQMLGVPSTSDIPTNVSQLQNDAGYLTQHQDISGKANSVDLATVATSGSYEDLSNKPTIPDVQINGNSIIENGVANIPLTASGTAGVVKSNATFGIGSRAGTLTINPATSDPIKEGTAIYLPITPVYQHESTFYGLAKVAGVDEKNSELPVGQYTDSAKTAIQTMLDVPSNAAMTTAIGTAIGNINSFDMAVVQELPTQDISTHTIYLVPKTGDTNDVYDEYVYINSNWEMVGNTQIDLSNYVQKTDYATNITAGVVKVNSDNGLTIASGQLKILAADADIVKSGSNIRRPIVPSFQHSATFYGLAKAAGDTTQSQSDNAVGTYTTEAKAAIRSMIGAAASADVTVQDVQVNGTSVLSNNIANIPIAAGNTFGVVRFYSGYGIDGNSNGLYIVGASSEHIKAGEGGYRPILTNKQHEAIFYGLAKAAGDTTQSQSNNAVGTYTAAAQTAIQNMLGVPSNNIIAIQSAQPTSPDTKIWVDQTEGTTVQVPTVDEMNTADALKADKTDTVLLTTLSMGRKAGTTVGTGSIALGNNIEASGNYSIATGTGTIANANNSFVTGIFNSPAVEYPNWVSGTHYNIGDRVMCPVIEDFILPRECIKENSDTTWTSSKWKFIPAVVNADLIYIVGNGTSTAARSNAYALDWFGNAKYAGDVYAHANADSTGGTRLATITELAAKLDAAEAGLKVVRLI